MIAQHLNDSTLGGTTPVGKLGDLDSHDLTMLRTTFRAWRHEYLVRDTGVIRHNQTNTGIGFKAPYNGLAFPFEYLNNLTLGATFTIDTGDHGQYFIAVKHLMHLPSG